MAVRNCKSGDTSRVLQSFIYTMNHCHYRTDLIRHHLKQSNKNRIYQWCGTWIVEADTTESLRLREIDPSIPMMKTIRPGDSFHTILSQKKNYFRNKCSAFTVCLVYDGNAVHYVFFLYDPKKHALTSFDPGVGLYLHGQNTIVPRVQKAFQHAGLCRFSYKNNHLGACHVYRFKKKTPRGSI